MTQVPEYLLERSRERRAALGLPPFGGGEAPTPAAPAEGAEAPAAGGEAAPAAAAVPAPTEAPVPVDPSPKAQLNVKGDVPPLALAVNVMGCPACVEEGL